MHESDDIVEEQPTPRPPLFSRWYRRVGLLLLIIGALPSLLTVSGMTRPLLRWVQPQLSEVTTYDRLTLHWWAPVECSGLRISNTRPWSQDAPPLLQVTALRTTRPLWKIATNLGRAVEVTITEPQLTLIDADNGSNLVDALQDLGGSNEGTKSTLPFRALVSDGKISVASSSGQPISPEATSESESQYSTETLISGIQCQLSTLNTSAALPEISLIAAVGDHTAAATAGIQPFADDGMTLNPRVAARLDELTADFSPMQLDAPVAGTEQSVPSLEVQIVSTDERDGQTARFRAGHVKLETLQPLIAQWIPGVRCRGLLSCRAESVSLGKSATEGMVVRAALRGTDVLWQQPNWDRSEALNVSALTADCGLAIADDGIIVQSLSARCPCAKISGDGEIRLPDDQLLRNLLSTASGDGQQRRQALSDAQAAAAGQINVEGSIDLVAIANMLPRTLNLRDGIQMRQGILRFAVQTQSASRPDQPHGDLHWRAVAETSPIIAQHNGRNIRWESPLRLESSGPLQLSSVSIDTATLSGDFGRVRANPTVDNTWHVQGQINVDQLWQHLGQFVDAQRPGIRGEVEIESHVTLRETAGIELRDLHVRSQSLQLESSALAINTDRTLLKMVDGQLTMDGSGAAVRSLVAPWIDAHWLEGASTVSVQLDAAPPERLTLVAQVRPATSSPVRPVSAHDGSSLRIDRARLALDIDTASEANQYNIRRGRLQIPGLQAELSGTLDSTDDWLTTHMLVDAEYDLSVLSQLALGAAARDIHVTGQHESQFQIEGTPAAWLGNAPSNVEPFIVSGNLAWTSVDAWGLRLGSGITQLRLADGQLRTEPIRCSVNGGQLAALVNYDLYSGEFALSSGSRVENLQLTPEMCREWLGYLSPFLADAAHVNGSISARVDRCRYTPSVPQDAHIEGAVQIHHAEASPGNSLTPILQAVALLRSRESTSSHRLTFPQQQVRLHMRNAIVTHDQLQMDVAGYHLQTRGSVGVDQRINMTLDIPIERSQADRRGRQVSVPVTGSIQRPAIDTTRLLQDVGTQSIQGELNDQLDRGLNRLFDKLR